MIASTTSTLIQVGDNNFYIKLSSIIEKGLPVLYIETVNQEEPVCDYVSAPAGSMGATITNATKVPGHLTVYSRINSADSVIYDSGDYVKDVSGMTIKMRGNTSAYDAKKPYKIKLQKKFDLMFGDTDVDYRDKEWLLLRDDYLTTTVGLMVNALVGMPWTPRHRFVNVVMNDRYRGVYLLCESVKRNPDCRLVVDKQWGFVYEFDPYWWNEPLYVTSSRHPRYNYTFKYPDDEDITEEQLAYMRSLVTAYESSLNNGRYTDYIDVRSFAGWCLVHDVMGTNDSGGANMYYTKHDATAASKIAMPLAWDFDMAYRTSGNWSRSHQEHISKLFNSTNRTFTREFVALWREIRDTFVADATGYMTAFSQSDEGVAANSSFPLDALVYGRAVTVPGQVSGCNDWITRRFTWLDQAINALNPLGDVNIDGVVDISDVTALIDILLTGQPDGYHYASDLDGNGQISIADVTMLIDRLLLTS